MPATWPAFQSALDDWFCGDAEGGDTTTDGSKTAKIIANEYASAISAAAITVPGNMYMTGFVPKTMEDGFNTSFGLQMQAAGAPPEGMDIGPTVWMAAAAGTINAWLNVKYQGMPAVGHGLNITPLSIVGAPTDAVQLDPGLGGLTNLQQAIHDAFHSEDCGSISGLLVSGFSAHMDMINGMYFGNIPSPTGLPPTGVPGPPVPWMGVS